MALLLPFFLCLEHCLQSEYCMMLVLHEMLWQNNRLRSVLVKYEDILQKYTVLKGILSTNSQ